MGVDVGDLDPGTRVVVRYLLPEADGSGHTVSDALGELGSVDDDSVVVRTRRGPVVVPRAAITIVKPVPPRVGRRGTPHRALTVEGLQEVMAGAWGALERDWLGRWQLRAGGGYTMRANSVALLGDPGLPLDHAVNRAREWYAARGLPLNVTLAGPVGFAVSQDPLGELLLGRGAHEAERCLTLTADTTVAAASLGTTTDALPVDVSAELDDAWLRAHRGYRAAHPELSSGVDDDDWAAVARAVLTGSPAQLFASARAPDGEVVAGGRAGLTPGWVGLASIWVEPRHRRRGLARAVSRSLLDAALARGHASAHLQVLHTNVAARRLYEGMTFVPHHDYVNLVLPITPDDQDAP